jgi:hypothetical protein
MMMMMVTFLLFSPDFTSFLFLLCLYEKMLLIALSRARVLSFVFHRQKMSKQDVTNEHYQYNNEQN